MAWEPFFVSRKATASAVPYDSSASLRLQPLRYIFLTRFDPLRLSKVSSLLLASVVAASAATQPTILQRVDDHYNHLTSLRTRYSEHYAGLGLNRTETGTLTLKKPGRMFWAYDQPIGKVFVLDGKYAWFYTPGDAQTTRIPARQLDDLRTPLRFLLGHTELQKELENIGVTPNPTGFLITGIPKGMQNRVKLLSLQVTPTGSITQMKIEEVDGATTSFTFTDQHENIPSKDSDFTFAPPPGVGIADSTPPL